MPLSRIGNIAITDASGNALASAVQTDPVTTHIVTVGPSGIDSILPSTLGALTSGIVKLASGTISSPVAYVDVPLNGAYSSYEFEWSGLIIDSIDLPYESFALVFSTDGGVTFITDATEIDAYGHEGWEASAVPITGSQAAFSISFADYAIDITNLRNIVGLKSDAPLPASAVVKIYPGSASELAHVEYRSTIFSLVAGPDTQTTIAVASAYIWPQATITPTPGRVNYTRWQPYGNGDVPPTSNDRIIAGSYTLWGKL